MDKSGLHPDELTRDAIYQGRLTLVQPRHGYRFSIDALLLADFARVKPGWHVVDLGAGVGVMALALAMRMGQGRVTAVEVQPRLAECARMNAEANPSEVRVDVLETDWTGLDRTRIGGPADYVVCNPPYRPLGAGRVNLDGEEAAARHEFLGGASGAAKAAARILDPRGGLALIYPAARMAGLFEDLLAAGFEPKRLRMVHSRAGERATLVLLDARLAAGRELHVEPPLHLYEAGQNYTEEAQAILAGESKGIIGGEMPDQAVNVRP
ncbi:MAG: methyltransferase [Proteobacteria bacterium]|nr:methyltransferase [Pseudomonadota bacterium]